MKNLTFILSLILMITAIESKCQDYKLDTITVYNPEFKTNFLLPKIEIQNKEKEGIINKLIYQILSPLFDFEDTSKTNILDLNYRDFKYWKSSDFTVLFDKHSILSIQFFIWGSAPIPTISYRTIDLKEIKLLALDDVIEKKLKNEFIQMVNRRINNDIDESLKIIKEDKDYSNRLDYLTDCYNGFRNQKTFEFYIEEMNKSFIIKPSCCCETGGDRFIIYYYGYDEISKYLNDEYKLRIR